ncbi:dTDP-4-dehydrorhamnose reductase [Bifidobacterium tissieri]|uniref:dTDP-4-dehydrorhamnose reductase n=1 Tax=Bifidobacterium tissieri TaxID=1630162 RepID=A0A261FJT3_9BIFI|nr:bifunctional dTDP-4-dehydrorhamnose 3,5-epimerase family protein/NAD(P)-dependent oxidoreductase [Bifidobacterium tissieri]OZG59412.1 dTDP-4-dehydrorhamnose reductase [Bifidobacterium tissieri]
MGFAFEKELKVTETNIPGLLVFDLPVHGDSRGWFKENWQRAKMTALGLPDFGPVQNNISFNATKGVTRGIHAEPWDKYISIASGEIFGAWVDLRPGESFGQVFTTRLDPSRAIYVPRGVGNSFQALEDGTVYTYLVNAYWSLEQKKTYTFVNLADPELGIQWPIPLEESERSEADLHHPMLKDAKPMAPRRTLVTGANGQLGCAIRAYVDEHDLQGFEFTDIDEFDFSDPAAYERYDWSLYGTIINAGAYTAVDKAETPEGRVAAWKANAQGPALLAKIATEHRLTLVHISSDYVFDGTVEEHTESEPFAPLGVYGQTKAAGDIAVANTPKHYILRSSWVIGAGHNFVKTMMMLSNRVADPDDKLKQVTVVNDQYGRLTFTTDMAEAIFHLLDTRAPYGTYNLTGSGNVKSWAEIATTVFEQTNGNGDKVSPISTDEYFANAKAPVSPRPTHSALDLSKISASSFTPADWEQTLKAYVVKELDSRATK